MKRQPCILMSAVIQYSGSRPDTKKIDLLVILLEVWQRTPVHDSWQQPFKQSTCEGGKRPAQLWMQASLVVSWQLAPTFNGNVAVEEHDLGPVGLVPWIDELDARIRGGPRPGGLDALQVRRDAGPGRLHSLDEASDVGVRGLHAGAVPHGP